MDHLENQKYKRKQLTNTRVLKVKSSTLELENDFKPTNVSVNDMDKFEKKNYQKNTCYNYYNWLINYISELIKNCVWRQRPNYESF